RAGSQAVAAHPAPSANIRRRDGEGPRQAFIIQFPRCGGLVTKLSVFSHLFLSAAPLRWLSFLNRFYVVIITIIKSPYYHDVLASYPERNVVGYGGANAYWAVVESARGTVDDCNQRRICACKFPADAGGEDHSAQFSIVALRAAFLP